MQFHHDIRLLPIIVGVCKTGERVYSIAFGDNHCLVHSRAHIGDDYRSAVLTCITGLKSLPLRQYETILGINNNARLGVRLVPSPNAIRGGDVDALRDDRWLVETYRRDRIARVGDRLVFVPRDLTERIPLVYEDTGEQVII